MTAINVEWVVIAEYCGGIGYMNLNRLKMHAIVCRNGSVATMVTLMQCLFITDLWLLRKTYEHYEYI